jgi:hypothetical protein
MLVIISMNKNLQKRKVRLSITENEPEASSQLNNQSNTGIESSPQATKANLGGKRQNDLLHQNLQESLQASYGTQCDDLKSSEAIGRVHCDVVTLKCTRRM